MAAIAYYILQRAIIAAHGPDCLLAQALGSDWKGKLSPITYLAGMAVAHWYPWIGNALYACMAILWVVPDRRIERTIARSEN